jgi:hypothetical protein
VKSNLTTVETVAKTIACPASNDSFSPNWRIAISIFAWFGNRKFKDPIVTLTKIVLGIPALFVVVITIRLIYLVHMSYTCLEKLPWRNDEK